MASPLDGAKWRQDWTAADRALIHAGMVRQIVSIKDNIQHTKPWFSTVDPEHCFDVVCSPNSPFESFMLNGYLLSMQLASPWWSTTEKVLFEQLLLKVDPATSNIRSVIRALVECGRISGAAGIAVGTALNLSDRKLARVYERAAKFRTSAHSLYLEIER